MIALLFITACPELPKHDALSCKFEQKKRSPLFRKELKSDGQLWVRGQKLRFDTSKSSLIVAGSEVTMKADGKVDKLPLTSAPKVEAFLSTFSGLFTGKADELDKAFDVKCTGDRWELTPKGDQPVKALALTFDGKTLRRIDLTEQSGDEISLTLSQCRFGAEVVPDSLFQ